MRRNPLYRTPEVGLTKTKGAQAGRLEAEEYLRQALAQRAIYPEALLQLASVSFERGSFLQARAFVQRFLDVTPPTAEVLLLGHQVEKALGDQQSAADFADRLRQGFPESAQLRALAGRDQRIPECGGLAQP